MENIDILQKLPSFITRSNELILENEDKKVLFRNSVLEAKDTVYNQLYILVEPEPVEPPPEPPVEPEPPVYVIRPDLTPEQISTLTSQLNTLEMQLADIDRLLLFWVGKTEQTDTTFLTSNQDFIDFQVLIFTHKKILELIATKTPFLQTPVSNNLISFDISTNNSYFTRYDKTNEYLIQFSDCFKDINFIDNYIKFNNQIETINATTEFNSTTAFSNWFNIVETRIALLNTTFNNITVYFSELKKVIIDFKIGDKKVKNDDWEGMYSSRDTVSKNRIDDIVLIYANGSKLYEAQKKEIMYQLKLENTMEY